MNRKLVALSLFVLSLVLAAGAAAPAHAGGLVPAKPPAKITNIESDDRLADALSSDGRVVFARRAAGADGQPDGWWLRLDVRIENQAGSHVTVTGITIDTDVSAPQQVALADPVAIAPHNSARIKVPGTFSGWGTMPTTLGVRATLSGYAQPIERIAELIEYEHPTSSAGYRFPGRAEDLPQGVYWSEGVHAHTLSQRYAYDFGNRRWDEGQDKWVKLTAEAYQQEANGGLQAGSLNTHYLIWERPVYALADATVVRCYRSLPDHLPGQSASGGGNSLILDLGDGTYAAYYHLRFNSIPQALCPIEGTPGGDETPLSIPVEAGQQIGKVGNSGHSSGPHLHMHLTDHPGVEDAHQRGLPLRFEGIDVHKLSGYNPETDLSGWNELSSSESAVPIDALIEPPCGGPGCFVQPAP